MKQLSMRKATADQELVPVLYISPSPPSLPLCFPSSSVAFRIVEEHKHLGIVIDFKLSCSPHVQYVCKRTSSILRALQAHCRHLPLSWKSLFYRCYILPLLDYCDTAWSGITTTVLNKLETHNRMLLKIILSKDRRLPSASLYEIAKISPLSTRYRYHLCVLIHKILHVLNKITLHMEAYNWFSETRNTWNSASHALPPPYSLNPWSLLAMCFEQHYQRRPRPASRWIILLLKSLLNYRFHVFAWHTAGLSPAFFAFFVFFYLFYCCGWLSPLSPFWQAVIMICHEIMIYIQIQIQMCVRLWMRVIIIRISAAASTKQLCLIHTFAYAGHWNRADVDIS